MQTFGIGAYEKEYIKDQISQNTVLSVEPEPQNKTHNTRR